MTGPNRNPDTASQARAIVHLVLDSRLQARVAGHPEGFADRFGFCAPGRELLRLGVEVRARLGDDRFARLLRVAALVAGEVLGGHHAGGPDARGG